ncbi:hypothetical protein EB75_11980 [Mycobacterium sp. ST-F2]|nr:hypothetical protein EB75_11980 [Mycobacterium sp. ST-F2]
MSGPAGLPGADDLGGAEQVQEPGARAVAAQLDAVLVFQRRAAHHAAVAAVLPQPQPDSLQPGPAVVVVQRVTGRHLRDVGGGVEVVRVGERHAEPLRERRAHRGLAGS